MGLLRCEKVSSEKYHHIAHLVFVNRGRGREFGEKRVGGGAHNLEKMGIGEKRGDVWFVRKRKTEVCGENRGKNGTTGLEILSQCKWSV